MAASFTAYRVALSTPGALVPVLSSALGRLPIAMFGLATLLYVQRVSGSVAAPRFAVDAAALLEKAAQDELKRRIKKGIERWIK